MKFGQAIQMYGNSYQTAKGENTAKVEKESKRTASETAEKTDSKTEKESNASKQGIRYGRDTLFVLGFNNAQIDQYFNSISGVKTLRGEEKNVCELKSGIVIDGKEINNIQDLINALGITSNSNRTEENSLRKWLEMNEQYQANKASEKTDIKTDKASKQGIKYGRDTLFVLGFNNEQVNEYFNNASVRTLGGAEKNVCQLKSDIVIDGKEINNLQDLINALGITSNSNRTKENSLKNKIDK